MKVLCFITLFYLSLTTFTNGMKMSLTTTNSPPSDTSTVHSHDTTTEPQLILDEPIRNVTDKPQQDYEVRICSHYAGRSYLFVASKRNWHSALSYCNAQGGNLASMHSSGENEWMRRQSNRLGGGVFWLGLSDRAVEGNWIWSDFSPVDFKIWAGGEPNNAGNEDCLGWQHNTPLWNDLPCHHEHSFVCKVPAC